jgi:hypothetical protein
MASNQEIENKLQRMVGETYRYRAKYYTIDSYEITEHFVKFIANGNEPLSCPINKALDWLKMFMLSESDEEIQDVATEIVVQDVRSSNTNLQAILLETIEKVRQDPKYVSQAKAITNTTNCLLNAFKLEIQLSKSVAPKKELTA